MAQPWHRDADGTAIRKGRLVSDYQAQPAQPPPVDAVAVAPAAVDEAAVDGATQRFRNHLFWLPICLMLPPTVMVYGFNLALSIVSGGFDTMAYDDGARCLWPFYQVALFLTAIGTMAWFAPFLYFVRERLRRRRCVGREAFLLLAGLFSNFFVFCLCFPLEWLPGS